MPNKTEVVNPPQLGKPSGFSHAIKTHAAGPLLFIAGEIASDENGRVIEGDFVAQFDRALANVVTVLRAAGGEPQGLARLTIYVVDKREYTANLKKLGEVYRRHLGRHYPAMTLVEVKSLLEPAAKLELEATAVL